MTKGGQIFLFLVFIMMFLSVVLRLIALRRATKNTKAFWKVSLASYIFIPPMVIGYFWRIYDEIFNGISLLYGTLEVTPLDYYRIFLMFLMLIAIVLLVFSMIVDREKTRQNAETSPEDEAEIPMLEQA